MVASPLAETKTCPTGKSANSCPALIEKIFRLTRRANHLYKSARLARKRGGSRSSRTWGGMRWTRQRQRAIVVAGRSFGFVSDRLARRRTMLSRTAKSCGPDAPTLASSFAEARDGPTGPDSPPIRKATVAKEPGHRGEHEISR